MGSVMQIVKNILDSKITLYVVIGVLAFFLFDLYHENRGLSKSNIILEEQSKSIEAENFRLLDSLESYSNRKDEVIEKKMITIADLEEFLNSIKPEDNETPVDNIDNFDSLQQLFTRNFPYNSRSGTGSN